MGILRVTVERAAAGDDVSRVSASMHQAGTAEDAMVPASVATGNCPHNQDRSAIPAQITRPRIPTTAAPRISQVRARTLRRAETASAENRCSWRGLRITASRSPFTEGIAHATQTAAQSPLGPIRGAIHRDMKVRLCFLDDDI